MAGMNDDLADEIYEATGMILGTQEEVAMTRFVQAREASARREAADEIERLQKINSELEDIFEKVWDADMRAIAAWQAANPGNDMVWPDRSELTLWLLSEIERLRTALSDIASGRYSSIMMPTHPPQDPATFRARDALGWGKP